MAFMAILAACSAGTEDSDARRLHEYLAEGKEQYLDGDYNGALATLHKYLVLSERTETHPDPDDAINTYIMLGNIHLAFSDYVRAYSYYENGLEYSREVKSPDNEVKFLNDLAIVSCYLGNRDDAMKFNEMLSERYLYIITRAYIEKNFGNRSKSIRMMKDAIAHIDSAGLESDLKLSAYS